MIGLCSLLSCVAMKGPPQVHLVSPSLGFAAGGTTVLLIGSKLTGASDVKFDGVSVAFTVDADGQITVPATDMHDLGAVDIEVTTPLGSVTLTGGYTYTKSPLSVTSFTPNHGDSAGVTSGTLGGTGFFGAASIELEPYIAGVAFVIVDDNTITLDIDGPGLGASPSDSVDFRVIRTISIDEVIGVGLFTFDP